MSLDGLYDKMEELNKIMKLNEINKEELVQVDLNKLNRFLLTKLIFLIFLSLILKYQILK